MSEKSERLDWLRWKIERLLESRPEWTLEQALSTSRSSRKRPSYCSWNRTKVAPNTLGKPEPRPPSALAALVRDVPPVGLSLQRQTSHEHERGDGQPQRHAADVPYPVAGKQPDEQPDDTNKHQAATDNGHCRDTTGLCFIASPPTGRDRSDHAAAGRRQSAFSTASTSAAAPSSARNFSPNAWARWP